MTDVHDPATRSRNMAAIRGADTGPELKIRRALHRAGLRYRLHVKRLPGRPTSCPPNIMRSYSFMVVSSTATSAAIFDGQSPVLNFGGKRSAPIRFKTS